MLVEAAKKYNRVVQDGAEQRSNPSAQSSVQYMRDGNLGEVYMAKGICYKWRNSIGKYADGLMSDDEKYASTVDSNTWIGPFTKKYMEKVNYDMWQGPAPAKPFNRNRFHTTGIGTGITEMATWEIREFTKWMWPVGDLV